MCKWASLVTQLVKNPPAMRETWVQSLGWEDPLEKGMATHSSILAWSFPGLYGPMGSQRVWHNWSTFTFTFWRCMCMQCGMDHFFFPWEVKIYKFILYHHVTTWTYLLTQLTYSKRDFSPLKSTFFSQGMKYFQSTYFHIK